LWVSERAAKDYKDLDDATRDKFALCFEKMTTHQSLDAHRHKAFQNKSFKVDCECFDADANPARPFYYRDRDKKRVVLCRLVYHPGTYDRLIDSHDSVLKANHPPYKHLSEIVPKRPAILFVSLGDTPMIASQAYALLKLQANVTKVVLAYPNDHPGISQKAHKLARDFQSESIACDLKPILGLKEAKFEDVNSTQACEIYLKAVNEIIAELQRTAPDAEIHLLLSGGRKSMATLNLFAAQRTGLTRVWHTLVKDLAFERQLEEELRQASNANARRNILFLRRHSAEHFALFAVPVFLIQ
jgi:hypothetical protein